jgi:glycine/D-amino acid oxidase-like deaminating enzyme
MFLHDSHHVPSYYAASCEVAPARPALQERLEVDVAIVGAGFAGLYTAIRLARAGKKVAIVEASRVGWGASGRNGGQLILGFSCDMPPFEAALGLEGAQQVWQLVEQAAAEIRATIHTEGIACDLRDGHLWTSVLERRIHLLTDWQEEAAHKWGHRDLEFIPKADLPQHVDSSRYQAGLLDRKGGHLHPLKYVQGLLQLALKLGVQIFEDTRAMRIEEHPDGVRIITPQGALHADKAVLACNAYVDQLDPRRATHVLPVGTYMIATAPMGEDRARALLPTQLAVTDNQFILDYFRLSSDHRLLFGGKCTYTGREPANLREKMRQDMVRVFPQLADVAIDFCWGGHIDITPARTPDFGRQDNIYWAQGFSGHGIVPTCVAGRVLSEALLGDDTHLRLFERLHNPAFPGGERLAALFQVLGMSYYRLRDYF